MTKISKNIIVSLVICFITLNLFELSYRYYLIDFYSSELKALNSEDDLNLTNEKTILVFGDSFSTNSESWVKVLKDSLLDYNIINSAIPGTTVFHQNLFYSLF